MYLIVRYASRGLIMTDEPNKIGGGNATDGLVSATDAAIAAAGPLLPLRDAEQLPLIDLPGKRLRRDQVEQLPRGRGRPVGATNRRTTAWRDYLATRYTHPLETLAVIQSQPVDKLAAELGCKPIEALAVIKSAAAELAPYMEGKMPVAIDMTMKGDMMLAIAGMAGTTPERLDEIAAGQWVDVDNLEMPQNQSVNAVDAGSSE